MEALGRFSGLRLGAALISEDEDDEIDGEKERKAANNPNKLLYSPNATVISDESKRTEGTLKSKKTLSVP